MERLRRRQFVVGLALLVGGFALQAYASGILLKLAHTLMACGWCGIILYTLPGRCRPSWETGWRAEWRKYVFPNGDNEPRRPEQEPERSANGYTMDDVNRVLRGDPVRFDSAVILSVLVAAILMIWLRDDPPVAKPPSIPGLTVPRTDGAGRPHANPSDRSP